MTMLFPVLFYPHTDKYTQMWEKEFYAHHYYKMRADELIRTKNY